MIKKDMLFVDMMQIRKKIIFIYFHMQCDNRLLQNEKNS